MKAKKPQNSWNGSPILTWHHQQYFVAGGTYADSVTQTKLAVPDLI